MRFALFVLVSIYLFPSCAFNSKFHHPSKIDLPLQELRRFDFGNDTTTFAYNEETGTIQLLDSQGNDKNSGLTITNNLFLSASGNQLNGWHIQPTHGETRAFILHFHGSGGNLLSQQESIKPLAHLGYEIFTFDYSGYGFSQGRSTRKSALLDAYSALEYATKELKVPSETLIIYGQSYGGYLASIVGSNRQGDIAGIVIEGGFSSHREEAKFTTPFWGNFVGNGLIADREITKNKKPLLVIHSNEDQVVPIKFGRKIFENAHDPKMFFSISGGHILGLQLYASEIANKMKTLMLD